MVLWHDCQIEKAENQKRDSGRTFAGIVPVMTLDSLQAASVEDSEKLRAGVKAGDHHSYFFMPAVSMDGLEFPDSYANLRFIGPNDSFRSPSAAVVSTPGNGTMVALIVHRRCEIRGTYRPLLWR